jgi:hypothetical protein
MGFKTNGTDNYSEAAKRLRDEIEFHGGSATEAELRDAWPLLWDAIDDLVRLVDQDHPRAGVSPRLFDPPH